MNLNIFVAILCGSSAALDVFYFNDVTGWTWALIVLGILNLIFGYVQIDKTEGV